MHRISWPAAGFLCMCMLGATLAPPASQAKGATESGTVHTRSSDIEEVPNEAWRTPGFRLGVGLGWQGFQGQGLAPSMNALLFSVEPGYRISDSWEISANLRYSPIIGGSWGGLRWAGNVEGRWIPWRALSIGLGVGYAGAMLSPKAHHGALEENSNPRAHCRAYGVSGTLRLGYLFSVGDLFATGPTLLVELQSLGCKGEQHQFEAIDNDPQSDEPLYMHSIEIHRERWSQTSFALVWVFAWR